MTSVTAYLAEVLAAADYADLPLQVREDTERAILDWLGSVLAGSLEPPARLARQMVAGLGRSDEATVFSGGRASAAGAALANGVASHILELDDIHKRSTVHGAAPIVPAALAVAEREHVSGQAFMTGVAVGYEAALRIGEAVNPSHYRYWHPTGTVATFGAAAAAGSVLGFTATEMLHALGNAGTQAAGLWEFNEDGAMSKHLHAGKAAFNGVLSADLARTGFTGARRILEGDRGFFRALSTTHDSTRIVEGLGTAWKISENSYKLYACCGHTHSAIDVALDIREQQRWTDDEQVLAVVSDVRVETYGPGFEIVRESNPRSPYQGKFSMAYCVAAALLEGRVGLEQFSPERFDAGGVGDPAIAELLLRVRVEVADDLTARYPAAWPVRMHVTLRDRSVIRGESDYSRGSPENPVDRVVLERKLVDLVEPRFGAHRASNALRVIRALEACTDVAQLFGALVPEEATGRREDLETR